MKRIAGKNVVLIGFMGTGKTEVGRLLADDLNRKHVDADRFLVEKVGKSINDIFAEQGQAYFRELEKAVILELSQQKGLVLSTGGGVILEAANVEALRESGFVVWLEASVRVLEQRLAGDVTRPLLSGNTALSELYLVREPLYRAAAHVCVDTTDKTPLVVAEEILALLRLEA